MSDATTHPSDALAVGVDKVWAEGETIFILSTREMQEWRIREFQRMPIYFRGSKYYLRNKTQAMRPFVVRYELAPWPQDFHDQSSRFVTYDEDYVAQREAGSRSEVKAEWVRSCLLPFYPFLGFLWSGFKERVLMRYGFLPISITSASVMLAFHFWVLEGVFAGWLRGGLLMAVFSSPALAWLDFALLPVLGLDCVVRCNQLLRGEVESPYGFLEWLWPAKKESDPNNPDASQPPP